VIDIMGGMFGAIAILAALQERRVTKEVKKSQVHYMKM